MAAKKPRAIGFNHIALEVGDIDEALDFYGALFEFKLRSKSERAAFIDLGDQFINFSKGREQAPDDRRHVGLVVDDKEAVRQLLKDKGVEVLPGRFLDFLDPWGNRIEIVGYENIQFTKAPYVLRGMGIENIAKNQKAMDELAEKGMAPRLGHELINCGDIDGKISFCGKALGVERCLSIVTDETTLSTKRKRVALKGRVLKRFRGVERPHRANGPAFERPPAENLPKRDQGRRSL